MCSGNKLTEQHLTNACVPVCWFYDQALQLKRLLPRGCCAPQRGQLTKTLYLTPTAFSNHKALDSETKRVHPFSHHRLPDGWKICW
mmetsp:Transcript_20298/g.61164  ORF Transcript_20298/g.61164 Transcript_20298/m.61164 type:complete len:86 (+) Transcript_20298:2163-2420(+)